MNDIFGLQMSHLLIAMLILLGASLGSVALIYARSRIFFLMGLRNIPRRVAQTVLIILGLMLSTLIITAAFTTGDTVNRSITSDIYRLLGHVDAFVEPESRGGAPAQGASVSAEEYGELRDRLAGSDAVDGVAPVLLERVPVIDPERRQSAPNATFVGLDETTLDAFPDLQDPEGNLLDLSALGSQDVPIDDPALAAQLGVEPGTPVTVHDVFANESLQDELDTAPGAILAVTYQNRPIAVRIVDIAKDRGLSGALDARDNEGLVARLSTVQQLLDRPNEFDAILVSATGGERDSVAYTEDMETAIEGAIESGDLPLAIDFTKEELLDQAETIGAGMLTFFLIFGLFSIAAGMLLIVMIFVMLAAERKSELGMARALGTKRRHLVEMFVAEGMGYNLVSALVGAALGVGVAFTLVGILAAIFAGADFDFSVQPTATPRSLVIAYAIGVVLTFATVVFSSWQASRLNIVRAIRDLPEPQARPGRGSLILMLLFGIFGGLLTFAGLAGGVLFPYALGMSLLFFGAALLGRFLHLPERPLFTGIGLVLLTFWTLTAGQITPSPGGGGPEMFVLSGVVMVAAASFVLVYNADLFLVIAATLGARSARILPALRTAIAYPMASKFRTGMTLAMIALVVFALTMMSVMNANFNRLFLDEDNFGGWDIQVTENPNNDLPGGLVSALQSTGADVDTDAFQAVGSLAVAPPGRWELCQPDASDCTDPEERRLYIVKGGDSTFFEESTMPLQARAEGYGTDEEVWRDIARSPDLAVIDSSALGGDFFDFGGQGDFFRLQGFGTDVTSFEPFEINVYDSNGEGEATVRVIGITSQGAAGGGDPFAAFFGLITRREVVQEVLGEIPQTNYFVRLEDDGTAEDVAHGIEASLLSLGAQAVSLEQERQEESALFNSFFYLMQAFAGLGLFVGIAAVGVVAFRSVVERRQQIGMLRAIGFNRRMVALSFVMESAFISMLGVLSGIGLAILLASFLLRSDEFAATGITSIVYPWERILLIGVFALIATFVMTFIPARQASSVPIAEALRYE